MGTGPTDPRRVGEPRRPEPEPEPEPGSGSERPNRFLGLALWQQIVAGLAVAAIIAIVAHVFTHHASSPSAPGNTHSATPLPSPTRSGASTPGGNTWLDQLTPVSGEVSSSTAGPNENGQPLPHEVLIPSAENANTITYSINGSYKTLNLEVADAGNGDVAVQTSIGVNLDGKAYLLGAPSATESFSPIVSSPGNWIINVSGVKSLQLVVQGSTIGQASSLLVSGELIGS
jgi:hypothetical protein